MTIAANTSDGRWGKTTDEARVERLAGALGGDLIRPGDEVYEEARRLWNGMIDKRPALIARCTGVADVIACVDFARETGLPLAVRGGGHNVAGYASVEGGLVIDLSRMNGVRMDPEARTVRAGGGATWGDLDRETQVFGLATPGGEVSVTGIAGLTLGGGVGYLRRKHGLSCDNLVSADVVTAAGDLVKASEGENPDLFWALRGGGGNFGVVTSFEYRLHEVGPEVMTLNVAYPFEQAASVLRAWRAFASDAPDEATTAVISWVVPPIPGFPQHLHGRPVILFDGMYAGPVEDGERAFAPLRELGEPLFDLSGPAPYVEAQSAFDGFVPDGDLYYWKSLYMDEISDGFIKDFIPWVGRRPSPRNLVVIRHLGGEISRVGEGETAFGNRDAAFNLSIDSCWERPEDTRRSIAWTRAFWGNMRRFSNGGVYLNFPGLGEGGTDLTRAGLGANYERLVAVKDRFDPDNLFRMNQNVKPSAPATARHGGPSVLADEKGKG